MQSATRSRALVRILGLFRFVDGRVAEELLTRNLLTEDTLVDILMTDFTNPVFSKSRCDLADTAPESGTDAESVRQAWIANLKNRTDAVAAGLLTRLSNTNDKADHVQTIRSYESACIARATNDAQGFADDVVKLASQRRAEFRSKFNRIVESPQLFPVDGLNSKEGALHMQLDCTLSENESLISK